MTKKKNTMLLHIAMMFVIYLFSGLFPGYWVFIPLIAIGYVLKRLFTYWIENWKCPHCGKHLGLTVYNQFCRHCKKDIYK